jgi:hypothetical protein
MWPGIFRQWLGRIDFFRPGRSDPAFYYLPVLLCLGRGSKKNKGKKEITNLFHAPVINNKIYSMENVPLIKSKRAVLYNFLTKTVIVFFAAKKIQFSIEMLAVSEK